LVVLLSVPDGLGGLVFRVRDRALSFAARRNGLHELNFNRDTDSDSSLEHPTPADPQVQTGTDTGTDTDTEVLS